MSAYGQKTAIIGCKASTMLSSISLVSPTNPYDANAIKVLANDGHHVGCVPKDVTSEIRKHFQLPCSCYIFIGNNNGTYYSDCYIRID